MKMVSNVKIAGSHQKKFNKKVGRKRNTTTDYPTTSSSQTVKKPIGIFVLTCNLASWEWRAKTGDHVNKFTSG